MPKIELNGKHIEYTIRKSKRAKHISMRVDVQKGLEVIYPYGIKQPKPVDVLRQNELWVLSALDKMETRREKHFRRQYQQGEIFYYLGTPLQMNIVNKSHGRKIQISISSQTLDVSLPPQMTQDDVPTIQASIENFYRGKAKSYLPERTLEIAKILGYEIKQIYIKNQKTRWGSCSTKKNINLNLRLMMAPHDAIDYIIIHELCHLTYMNHSKDFWDLVRKHNPHYQHWKNWFKQNSQYLVL